jgi:hypothetical protein
MTPASPDRIGTSALRNINDELDIGVVVIVAST